MLFVKDLPDNASEIEGVPNSLAFFLNIVFALFLEAKASFVLGFFDSVLFDLGISVFENIASS